MIKSELFMKILIHKIIKWTVFTLFILVTMVGQNMNIISHSQHLRETSLQKETPGKGEVSVSLKV